MASSAMLAGMEQNSNGFLSALMNDRSSISSGTVYPDIRNKYNGRTINNSDDTYNTIIRIQADSPSASDPYGRHATIEVGRIAEVAADMLSSKSSSDINELRYEITKLHDIAGKQRDEIEAIKGMTQFLMDENASLKTAIKILTEALEKRNARQKKNKQRGAINVQNSRISV